MFRALLALITAVLWCVISLPVYFFTSFARKKDPAGTDLWSLHFVQRVLRLLGRICGVRLHVSGQEKIPASGGVLFIGNHASIFDVILVYPLFSRTTGFIAKKEILRVPVFGLWMKRLHCLALDREDPKQAIGVIKTAIQEIRDGNCIFIFPEGTRTKTGQLGTFHQGSFKPATRTGCPIVPVSFTHTADIVRNHIPFVRPTDVWITFGDPVRMEDLSPEDKKHIGPYMEHVVRDMLDRSR